MAISEIEKLERRYAENPHGLTFAPLAEIYRKNGDVEKALGLLAPGLALHPDYIPASIVLGRCHLDLGDQHAAEAAFTHVLTLDGENVIALKALADITERLLRLDDAERWLQTLLSVDRSNDDARDQLERVRASQRQAEMASSAAPDAAMDEAGTTAGLQPVEALHIEPFVADPEAPSESPPPSLPPPPFPDVEGSAGMAWVSDTDASSSEEAVPLALEDLQPESTSLAEPVEPLMGLVGRSEEEVVVEPLPDLEPFDSTSDDFQVEMSEDIVLQSSGASEFQMPNAAEELIDSSPPPPAPEPVRTFDRSPEPELEPMPEPEPEPVAQAEPQPVVRAAPPASDAPMDTPADPMITETMAELLARQGHHQEALSVYRELEVRAGGDSRLQQKIADIEDAWPAPAPRQRFAATDTGGQSTRAFLHGLLGSRPPAAGHGATGRPGGAKGGPAPEATGAPTRPAHDTLSLSSVFGEEGTPTRPAVPAAGPAASGGVSFDEFFHAPAHGGGQRQPRSPDPKSDDLDQFHTWLQNLKR